MLIRKHFDRLLSEGKGRQLIWLVIIAMITFLFLFLIANHMRGMTWEEVLGLYMDPGNFYSPGEEHVRYDFLRIMIVLLGVILFSALLISVFTNVFDNISESYQKGERRYKLKKHILIIGSKYLLKDILLAIGQNKDFDGKNILIMTTQNIIELRAKMRMSIADRKFLKRIIYYHGTRNIDQHLKDACADKAEMIYVLGEDKEKAHDALSLSCLNSLIELCNEDGPTIKCYVLVDMHSTLDVFRYSKQGNKKRLHVEMINYNDYIVEQFLVRTDFLPVMKMGEEKHLHIVIFGSTSMARAFASTVAQISHFPNFSANTRTVISFVGHGIREDMDNYVANHQSIFDLCHYRYISEHETIHYSPKSELGDFMDIEWEFYEGHLSSPFIRERLCVWAKSKKEDMLIAMCYDDNMMNVSAALHLPKTVYDTNTKIAVYQKGDFQVMKQAVDTCMFGNMHIFGEEQQNGDPLMLHRSDIGKRVNRIYDLKYGNPPAVDADFAWATLSHIHKESSIASGNSILTKLRSVDVTPTPEGMTLQQDWLERLSEMEHRRWMTTMLMMGYSAADKATRRNRSLFNYLKQERYIHLDIAPYDELIGEQDKDRLIIDNMIYILYGNPDDMIL